MAKIYRNLIIKKEKTIEGVPQYLKEQVMALLKEEGFDGYGEPLTDTQ